MQNREFKDRRIHQRVPVKLSFRLLDLSSNRHSIAQTQDISTEGIGVLTDEELQLFSPLQMQLPMLNKDESIYAKGEIVWSKMVESNKYKAGIKLEGVDPEGIMQLIWGYMTREHKQL